ncbi:xanthine dehydrogenase family protein subunit M [Bradyrhizobium sp. CCBAU 51753]|uniref:FAD binding domain-containing protein n=1 Tax=Bradyrhizobium sp. CCBAU 51753 TaxID=1325100 RepID=UPI00188BCB2E|nr:xanthine dehydrogenase family protein subunit M [Bradyrhizobium sp. CCBAU 51753]QOZ27331.1 xanthine dehydrogenase family protein subunit M [Bradyrhizobium sp. CCBAU 51753]
MKAAAFTYARATSVVNALELLAAHGDRAKVLSGGQSLMPAMNLRLVSPDIVVDIGGLTELRGIAVSGDVLAIGALTRHVDLLRSPEVAAHAPLLRDAVAHVAHPAIRNRGTVGGSLAHADPASEIPACMAALDATIVVRGPGGERRIATAEFFRGIYETALSPQDLLVAVELPLSGEGARFFFQEYARRHGDYAIVGLAARALVGGGQFTDLQLGFFAVGDRPLLADAARKLINVSVTPALLAETAAALAEELDPEEDQQASPAMRRHLATVLMRRCVAALLERPELETGGAW